MSYSKSHVILIAFAIDTPDSLENVETKASYYLINLCVSMQFNLMLNVVYTVD